MGQGPSHMNVDEGISPGTYRIISGLTSTAIQVSEHDHTKVVAWERHDGDHQKWFLQRSGDGYQFKNRRHGLYLAVASTDIHTLVYASRYPTTWVLLKTNDCYMIKFADNNRVLDLHFGWGNNGNEIHLWPADGNANKTWKLERVGDDTGEVLPEEFQREGARLQRELQAKNECLLQKEQDLALKEREILEKREDIREKEKALAQAGSELAKKEDELSKKEDELSEQRSLLSQRNDTIRQLQQELQLKEEALTRADRTNERTSHQRNQPTHLHDQMSQQQNEVALLQAKMERFERLMSQMLDREDRGLDRIS